jgi:hypothetical protein
MMLQRLFASVIVVGALLATSTVSASYAVIAYSVSTGNWGGAYNYADLLSAEQAAYACCNASDEKIVVTVQNGWCALARGDNGAWGAAWSTTSQADADYRALVTCEQYGANSKIVDSLYSNQP